MKFKYAFIFLTALFLAPLCGQEEPEDKLRAEAQNGNLESCFFLGNEYFYGENRKQNFTLRRIGSAKPPKEAFRKRSSITRIVWRRGAGRKRIFFPPISGTAKRRTGSSNPPFTVVRVCWRRVFSARTARFSCGRPRRRRLRFWNS